MGPGITILRYSLGEGQCFYLTSVHSAPRVSHTASLPPPSPIHPQDMSLLLPRGPSICPVLCTPTIPIPSPSPYNLTPGRGGSLPAAFPAAIPAPLVHFLSFLFLEMSVLNQLVSGTNFSFV